MSSRPSVLFLTNPENGQSNVVLAVAYELLKSNNLNIHVASWPLLEPRLAKISAQVASENPSLKIQPITFHCMPFKSIHTSYETNFNTTLANIPHKPGWKDLDKLRDDCPKVFTPEPEDHMESVRFCVELGEKIDPALILLDPICNPAHDMARYGAGGRWKDKHAVLSPCSIHGGIVRGQNFLQCLFRFPGPWTGFPYPLPWLYLPESIYSTFVLFSLLLSSARTKVLNKVRVEQGMDSRLGVYSAYMPKIPHFSPSLPELDLPFPYGIPDNVHHCGPILLPSIPVSESDPELFRWLKKGPTVLITLGTIYEASTQQVAEIAGGLRILLEKRRDIQVLWKLRPQRGQEGRDDELLDSVLGGVVKEGRVRIREWLEADPVAILRSGHVVAFVNHGGANSFFEGAWAGIPQILLPAWYDCYDYATRVEYLGIGIYGNKKVAPDVDKEEFANAVLRVIGAHKGEETRFSVKAKELGVVCRRSGGRKKVAEMISELVLEGKDSG